MYVCESYIHAYDNTRKVWIMLENLYDNLLVHCKDFSVNTAQEKGNRRKRTSDRAQTRDLHSFAELQPHEPSVPAANPSSPIAFLFTVATGVTGEPPPLEVQW